MPQDADSTEPTTVVANFRLPAFSTVDTAIWFRRAEVQFRIKKVKDSSTQADHVLAALPDAIFPQIAAWLDAHGTNAVKYEDLKAYLLKKFSLTPEQRVKSILSIAQQPLGDQRPSDALSELRSLARLPPDATGTPKSIDMLLALWLNRLPEKVRACITDFSSFIDDAAIASAADKFLDAQNAASKSSIAALAASPPAVDHSTSDEDIQAAASLPRQQKPVHLQSSKFPPKSSPSTYPAKPSYQSSSSFKPPASNKFCYYHSRFRENAQKCQPPCAWSSKRPISSSTISSI